MKKMIIILFLMSSFFINACIVNAETKEELEDIYKTCKENNLYVEYHPNITFEYFGADNKKHYYHPDFKIQDKLYEVKGEHFFDGDKMINPYDRGLDNLFEAKHQCMKNNGVVILRDVSYNTLDKILKGGE